MSRKCPVCSATLDIPQSIKIKQQVACPKCGLQLEVVWLYPLELGRVGSPPDGVEKENNNQIKKAQGFGSSLPAAENSR